MSDQSLAEVNRRITALERENRFLRRIGAAGLVVVLAATLVGQAGPKEAPVPEVLRAQRLEILDPAGIRRLTLGPVDLGQSVDPWGMTLHDKNGTWATTFGCRASGESLLWMRNPKKQAQVSVEFGVSEGGMPHLSMLDDGMKTRIRMLVKGGTGKVSLLADDGTVSEEMTSR